jgi:lysophospholipase L1-like esterase
MNMNTMGKALRYFLLLVICLVFILETSAQSKKDQIACIGNSITFGARVQNPASESYPAVLHSLLQGGGYSGYQVKNFGIGGATVIRYGTPNIWKTVDSLKLFRPDVVVIEVGTNETVGSPRYNWEHIGDFEKDYSTYVKAIKDINPNCAFILCSPLDMVIATEGLSPERINDLTLRRPRIWELRKRARKIAKAEGAYFLDLTKPFEGRSDLMTVSDGVHPNKDGYNYMAKLVFDFMVKKRIVQ